MKKKQMISILVDVIGELKEEIKCLKNENSDMLNERLQDTRRAIARDMIRQEAEDIG